MTSPDDLVTVSIACGNSAEATNLANALVESRLAACTQIHPVDSTFSWQGALTSEAEILLVAKTVVRALPELERLVVAKHSYEVPEIIAHPVVWAHAAYADWVRQNVD